MSRKAKIFWVALAILGAFVLVFAVSAPDKTPVAESTPVPTQVEPEPTTPTPRPTTTPKEPKPTTPPAETPDPVEPPETEEAPEPVEEEAPEPELTAGQANALSKAGDYLDYMAFSRKGLIEQLEFDGFSTADATYGAEHVEANWNEQAARKAKDYLDYMAFSRSGLIDQLEFDGFTAGQAEHGVDAAGL